MKSINESSLSARRAWIEISTTRTRIVIGCVSLSARRAWIEMPQLLLLPGLLTVALRKESVDRNFFYSLLHVKKTSRSPQGERG